MAGASQRESQSAEHSVICPRCGLTNPVASHFCGGCGKALDQIVSVMPEAERRHICVLFCDLVGSTPLSYRLDAEELRDVVGSFQSACNAVVLRHDGFAAQCQGDNIVVYFGYPQAHEDDASRAVHCALEMLEAVRQLGNVTKLDLQVRIGIHAGRVVVGTLAGGDPSERLAVGQTPNVAARLQAEAAPGEVVVSELLSRLLRGRFRLDRIGVRYLKGVERPMELFKVVAPGTHAAGMMTPRTPFIGHSTELNALEEQWSSVKTSVARFIILRGEPGIGKSRLVEEFRVELQAPTWNCSTCAARRTRRTAPFSRSPS